MKDKRLLRDYFLIKKESYRLHIEYIKYSKACEGIEIEVDDLYKISILQSLIDNCNKKIKKLNNYLINVEN
jgi:hypothetical protein